MADSGKDHANEFIDSWPNVSEHVVNEPEQEGAAEKPGSEFVDAFGNQFDPELHVVDKEGNPKKTPKGRFRKRPKKKGTSEQPSGAGVDLSATRSAQGEKEADQAAVEAGAYQAAEMAVNMQVLMAVYMGGDEWRPGKDDFNRNEYKSGVEAYKSAFLHYDVNYLPPWLPPAMWTMGFFGRRIMKDRQAQSKIKLFFAWLKSKFSRRKNKQKNEAENARDDTRNDGKRKNIFG